MADKTRTSKLLIKPGQALAILNAPDHYLGLLAPLPDGVTLSQSLDETYDAVHVFVYHKADVERLIPAALAAVKPGALLWIMYPKKSGSIKTDITRDTGWETVDEAGWLGVTQISIDDTWSALRFRPRAEIKSLTRKF